MRVWVLMSSKSRPNIIVPVDSQPAFSCSKWVMETMTPSWFIFHCYLLIDFTNCSGVSNVEFEQVNASWLDTRKLSKFRPGKLRARCQSSTLGCQNVSLMLTCLMKWNLIYLWIVKQLIVCITTGKRRIQDPLKFLWWNFCSNIVCSNNLKWLTNLARSLL